MATPSKRSLASRAGAAARRVIPGKPAKVEEPKKPTSKRTVARKAATGTAKVATKTATKAATGTVKVATKTAASTAKKTASKAASTAKKAAPAKKAPAKTQAKAPAKKTTAKKAPSNKEVAAPVKKSTASRATASATATAKKATETATATAKKATSTARKATAPASAAASRATSAAKDATGPVKSAVAAVQKAVPTARKGSAASLVTLPDEDPWTKEELADVRSQLRATVKELTAQLDVAQHDIEGLMKNTGEGAGHDQADVGSATFERDQEVTIANNARDMLTQAEHALDRIGNGSYGVCESCGNAIGKNRLMVFPRATMCMSCKQREERR